MSAPTIGRRVYFWPTPGGQFNVIDDSMPLDAGVVFVYPDGPDGCTINLLVTDHHGIQHAVLGVPFGEKVDDDDAEDAGGRADWMPYQKAEQRVVANP